VLGPTRGREAAGAVTEPSRAQPPAPRSADRFPALDAIRGLAALAVVAFHSYKDLAGRPGWDSPLGTFAYSFQWAVPVFFVLSGFLLYRPFAAAIADGTSRPDARSFLLRRAARIFPAYWVALVVFGTLAKPNELWTPDGIVRYGLLLQVFDGDTVYHVLGTAWSLSIEVGFYLALPLLAAVAARAVAGSPAAGGERRASLARHLLLLAGLTVAAWAVRVLVLAPIAGASGEDPDLAGFTVVGSFAPFAAGMALAVVSVSRPAVRRALAGARAPVRMTGIRLLRADGPWLALAALAYSFGLILESRTIVPWQPGVFATIAAVALLTPLVLRPRTSAVARRLGASRALVGLGAISYGLYLWHWPIQELARTHGFGVPQSVVGWAIGFAVMATLGGIAAYASYRLLESPINTAVRSVTARPRRRADDVGGLESGSVSGSVPGPRTAATAGRARRRSPRTVARAES
jgi:peptidoglycan/LPS O-acetylase OafA/YrhL